MNERFFRFLQERIGLDVESVGTSMIERALRQRCVAVQARDLEDYWLCLQQSADEQQALIEAVIVPETWFFRYPDSFKALVSLAHKRLAELAGVRPLRLLSLPCSTGEEPYSIAMALLDGGINPASFQVDGMDISPGSIARARQGVYGRNAFRGGDLAFRSRHFSESDEGHRLDERVRHQVNLEVGNVLDAALKRREGQYDFVFCRNLLIYFDMATQQRVFEVLKLMIEARGVLFIGPAEGSLLARLGMRPVGIAQSFAYVRHDQAPAARPSAAADTRTKQPVPAMSARPRVPAPASVPRGQVDGAANANSEHELLARIAQQANAGNAIQARADCERYLQRHAPTAQVYYWLGLLSDTEGNSQEAVRHYRKALYLEPQHPETLVHLAALLASLGDKTGALRLQERAERAGRESER
ncbi:tetratricopeptide repeat protein [Pseudomonas capeferrum]|uniref:CheR family methyltransferase n=1 Tax=Pseudomonas capeferrum TaxID=1495066 RepID=UPI0015E3142E|nr:protein-glutamate O-methyltransferase CheR [Pseudomonas capeferrum]MBA1203736.1 tetratricopeptide repeat protein [Pseudomonas capeferrum]